MNEQWTQFQIHVIIMYTNNNNKWAAWRSLWYQWLVIIKCIGNIFANLINKENYIA